MTSVVPPRTDGYDWPVDASKRLEDTVKRRAELDQQQDERAAEAKRARMKRENVQYAENLARHHGVDLNAIKHATDEDFARKDAELQRERRAVQAEIRLRSLPYEMRAAKLQREIPEHSIALKWLLDYRAGNRYSLVIFGTYGTGKTYTAAAIAVELLSQDHVPVTFTTVADLLGSLRPSADTSMELDLQLYKIAPVLVLDDLGAERLTEWGREQLTRIAHYRHHNGLPTITTTNLKPAEIREHCGDERLVQRLFGGGKMMTLVGNSRRSIPFDN